MHIIVLMFDLGKAFLLTVYLQIMPLTSKYVIWMSLNGHSTLNFHYYDLTLSNYFLSIYCGVCFLADRTNGRAIGTLLRPCVCLSSVTLCIVAKRCVLEQNLLLRAYRKSYMRNRLVPK